MFILGKVLQAFGCADVGFGLYVGLTQPHGMGRELQITAIGVVVFILGYLAQQLSRARS